MRLAMEILRGHSPRCEAGRCIAQTLESLAASIHCATWSWSLCSELTTECDIPLFIDTPCNFVMDSTDPGEPCPAQRAIPSEGEHQLLPYGRASRRRISQSITTTCCLRTSCTLMSCTRLIQVVSLRHESHNLWRQSAVQGNAARACRALD